MKYLKSKFSKLLKPQQSHLALMIIGLDNSGKTSILNSLVSSQSDSYKPCSSSSEQQLVFEQTPATDLASDNSESLDLVSASKLDRPNNQLFLQVAPTAGYNYQRVEYKSAKLTVVDISGQNRYRSLWQEFYDSVDGIVFVIDSSDLIRLVVVRDELELLVSHQYFGSLSQASSLTCTSQAQIVQKRIKISQGRLIQSPLEVSRADGVRGRKKNTSEKVCTGGRTQVPILFLANKSDLANSIDTEVIAKALNLSKLSQTRHPWLIQATSVTLNKGITEGFDWLMNKLL